MSELLDKAEALVIKTIDLAIIDMGRGTQHSPSGIETLVRAATMISHARTEEPFDGKEVGGS